ncbi:ferritin family protein [Nanoarchaeota archaeon]
MADDILGWTQFAIKLEEKGIKFYTQVYEASIDRNVKELFLFLINAEKQHKEALQKLLSGFTDGDDKLVAQSIKSYMGIKQKLPIFRDADLDEIKKTQSLMKKFNKAMDLELEGMAFYSGLVLKAKDPLLKRLFKKLAGEELKHKQAIERLGFSMIGVVKSGESF